LETKIVVNWSVILFVINCIVLPIFGFFIHRMVKGYDDQIKELQERTEDLSTIRKTLEQITELFERTKDLPAIREAISWLKNELYKK
jgi:hypothetical protein